MQDADIFKLKAITRRLIERAGGYEAAASLCRVCKSRLWEYASSQGPHMKKIIPIDVVCDLEADVGEAILSSELVRMAQEKGAGTPAKDFSLHFVELTSKFGQAGESLAQALEDGVLTPAELKEYGDKLGAGIDHARAVRDRVRQEEHGGNVVPMTRRA